MTLIILKAKVRSPRLDICVPKKVGGLEINVNIKLPLISKALIRNY